MREHTHAPQLWGVLRKFSIAEVDSMLPASFQTSPVGILQLSRLSPSEECTKLWLRQRPTGP